MRILKLKKALEINMSAMVNGNIIFLLIVLASCSYVNISHPSNDILLENIYSEVEKEGTVFNEVMLDSIHFWIGSVQGCSLNKIFTLGESKIIENGIEIVIVPTGIETFQITNVDTIKKYLINGSISILKLKTIKVNKAINPSESEFDSWEYSIPFEAEYQLIDSSGYGEVSKTLISSENDLCELKKKIIKDITLR